MAGQVYEQQLTPAGEQRNDRLPGSAAQAEGVQQEQRRAVTDAIVGEGHTDHLRRGRVPGLAVSAAAATGLSPELAIKVIGLGRDLHRRSGHGWLRDGE